MIYDNEPTPAPEPEPIDPDPDEDGQYSILWGEPLSEPEPEVDSDFP